MALSQNTVRKAAYPGHKTLAPVQAGSTIYKGAFVATDASGYVVEAADTSNYDFLGVATQYVDNASGNAGDVNIEVETGNEIFWAYSSAAQTDNGQEVYATGDDTLATSASNIDVAGKIMRVSVGTGWWVKLKY